MQVVLAILKAILAQCHDLQNVEKASVETYL